MLGEFCDDWCFLTHGYLMKWRPEPDCVRGDVSLRVSECVDLWGWPPGFVPMPIVMEAQAGEAPIRSPFLP